MKIVLLCSVLALVFLGVRANDDVITPEQYKTVAQFIITSLSKGQAVPLLYQDSTMTYQRTVDTDSCEVKLLVTAKKNDRIVTYHATVEVPYVINATNPLQMTHYHTVTDLAAAAFGKPNKFGVVVDQREANLISYMVSEMRFHTGPQPTYYELVNGVDSVCDKKIDNSGKGQKYTVVLEQKQIWDHNGTVYHVGKTEVVALWQDWLLMKYDWQSSRDVPSDSTPVAILPIEEKANKFGVTVGETEMNMIDFALKEISKELNCICHFQLAHGMDSIKTKNVQVVAGFKYTMSLEVVVVQEDETVSPPSDVEISVVHKAWLPERFELVSHKFIPTPDPAKEQYAVRFA